MTLYHLGCGHQRLDGFVNVDIQPTEASDLVLDLNTLGDLPGASAQGFFSHAFFEHLYRDSRLPHLQAVRERLVEDGFACYLGLPDFRRIAELYLAGGPGVERPTFDLHEVYRLTHGDPEMGGTDWLAQLHKSLFDVGELDRLLRDAGFPSYLVLRYAFPGDPADMALGFYATAARRDRAELERDARAFLARFEGTNIVPGSLVFVDARSRPAPLARALAGPGVLSARGLARRAANRLAQLG